jgi:hypothetical protein
MRWRLMVVADVAVKVGDISYMIKSGIVLNLSAARSISTEGIGRLQEGDQVV